MIECGYECSKRHNFCASCPDPLMCIHGYTGPDGEILTPPRYIDVLHTIIHRHQAYKDSIEKLHSCNDCALATTCKYHATDPTRINCPLWEAPVIIVKNCESCMCKHCRLACTKCDNCNGALTHCNDFIEI